ncbi:MAG TPA: hypothetical protein PK325_12160 [Cyclobacteriaceae bacterium]|nr:hypothetical protein [Cyclobacteriaceae bacterium]HMV08738.1 hypothetical protein [Cyclobacteriaceae bacterium]HMV90196.1 hypothetical protein [Cyclobacteriaceae bacterium]HMW99883.1 hypothetical protein [Cyclobacteriaceae bacterium]HMX49254.1 hypothetical protein [Cyclobacteriaceae bacterium]
MDKTFTSPYSPLWNKYRPAIVKMMIEAPNGTQTYRLFAHEVKALDPKSRSSKFTLRIENSKSIVNPKDSVIASDLFHALTLSNRASGLMQQHTFEFTLDRDFTLSVSIV